MSTFRTPDPGGQGKGSGRQSVDAVIASLREVVGVASDAELAKSLRVDKSTVSSWRARGRVPQRFARLTTLDSQNLPVDEEFWPELQNAAHRIALVRFTLLRSEAARSGNVDKAMAIFLPLKPFWLIMHRAAAEVHRKMEALGANVATALALVMQEDLRDPEATAVRVGKDLAEDIADNPHIPAWEP